MTTTAVGPVIMIRSMTMPITARGTILMPNTTALTATTMNRERATYVNSLLAHG